MREAPIWAQRGTSVLMEGGRATGATLAGSTGAFTGAVIGGAKAGTLGAMVGAGLGGAAGAALGYGLSDEDEKNMRAWSMDFLPWGSLQTPTTSPEAEPHSGRSLIDLSPVEPFAVLMPLINVMMGESDFGQQIPVTGPTDVMAKSIMGFAGFLAPPLIQKYGMRVGDPDTGLLGLDTAGTRLGAATIGAGVGLAGGGLPGAVIGGIGGGLVGANTVRLQEDLGLSKSTRTGQPGNPIFDVLLNSFTGMGVSWKATPEQRLYNEGLRRERFSEVRAKWQKQMDYAILNGDDEMFAEAMGAINRSFTTEYLNPRVATDKFGEYAKRRLDKIGRHPQLKGYSEERLAQMLDEALNFARGHRGAAMDRRVNAIRQEMLFRLISRENEGLNVGGYDYDINTASGLLGPALAMKARKARKSKKKGGFDLGGFSGSLSTKGYKGKGFL
jgi:hypothetical protein